jgi:hypothetical protein
VRAQYKPTERDYRGLFEIILRMRYDQDKLGQGSYEKFLAMLDRVDEVHAHDPHQPAIPLHPMRRERCATQHHLLAHKVG